MTQLRPPPAWLEVFQARFSTMLRTPLDRSTGTLRDRASAYDAAVCATALPSDVLSAAERLAVYNRQYWFRLFSVLQHEYRLTTRLLGAWSFNELAARFLLAHPPREHDLARAADGLLEFLVEERPEHGLAVLQAARIDEAFRAVFRAPEQPRLTLTAADAAHLEHARLTWSSAVRLIEQDWPLLELRARHHASENPLVLPAPQAREHWAIVRSPEGQRLVPLAPLQAKLMTLLEQHPLDVALAELERGTQPADAPALAEQARRWLADGMRLGFWTGFVP